MRYRDKKRLSLKLFIFCSLYTFLILYVVYYTGSRITTATTNINKVKSIESYKIRTNEEMNDNTEGILEYTTEDSLNCLTSDDLISNNKYKDSQYGEVLILKTNNYYSCYSIIKMSKNDNQYFYGIVLDRNSKIDKNTIQIIENKEINNNINKKNITYKIERFDN